MISAAPARPQRRDAPRPTVLPTGPRTETPTAARLRHGTAWLYAGAVTAIPVSVFWAPALGGDWWFLAFLLWGGMIAVTGLMLLVFAVVRRTARDAAGVLAALLALAGAIWLLPLAGTAGREAALDRHAAGLEALAVELGAAPPEVRAVLAGGRPEQSVLTDEQRRAVHRLREQARALGFYWVRAEPGYVLFMESAPFAPDPLYVAGASVPQTVGDCRRPELRFAGGRWYTHRCQDNARD
ncbi:MAG TPA: hypothetical protein VF746_22985 [Longimicrobium sp.]|jgi:hypothetical protein